MNGFVIIILAVAVIAAGIVFFIPKHPAPAITNTTMKITSPAFENGASIPAKYTCTGQNINPELNIENVPSEAKSLALIMTDPDIPDSVKQSRGIQVYDHWVVFNIPSSLKTIPEATEPEGTPGSNSSGKTGYTGPCPPDREHRYFFKLYGLDTMLDLSPGARREDVEKAMHGYIIAQAELMGLYKK